MSLFFARRQVEARAVDPAAFARGDDMAHLGEITPERALRLAPGEYLVDVAVHARDGAPYDYRRKLLSFSVTSPERGVGVYFPEHRWEFEGGLSFEPRSEP